MLFWDNSVLETIVRDVTLGSFVFVGGIQLEIVVILVKRNKILTFDSNSVDLKFKTNLNSNALWNDLQFLDHHIGPTVADCYNFYLELSSF